MWEIFEPYWDELAAGLALLHLVLQILTIFWVLTIKKDYMAAMAWCLLVLLLPVVGMLMFVFLGWQQVHRPVSRKAEQKRRFRQTDVSAGDAVLDKGDGETCWEGLDRLAHLFDATPARAGNHIAFYYEGQPAFDAKLEAIRAAKHHIHLEYFIVQPDELGKLFLETLTAKAREGVEVRLIYDAMGSHRLHSTMLHDLRAAGGKCCAFLPLNPLRRRIQINMRNHRKILVVDGQVAFTGGLNIGDEYLGKVPRYGFWRDTHLRAEGPIVAGLQRVFTEDWDFAFGEHLRGPNYFPPPSRTDGPMTAQIIHSGPDQELKGIREMYFAAISRARKRLWIASPYFVPDAGLHDALCMAGYNGVDVRLLGLFNPDKWVPYFAARYYWTDMLAAGVKVYQYTKGMMHSKVMLADGEWASVGTANLDNRSLHLNFEVNCLIHTNSAVAELEAAFCRDLEQSIELKRDIFASRPFAGRLIENGCRLLSPIL